MTVSSPVQTDVRDYIRRKLETMAQENRVKLLFGIESGSRAWGFPSADSDYDVRFVYRCTMDDYLSVADRRDVIETPTVHDEVLGVELDLNGGHTQGAATGVELKRRAARMAELVDLLRQGRGIAWPVAGFRKQSRQLAGFVLPLRPPCPPCLGGNLSGFNPSQAETVLLCTSVCFSPCLDRQKPNGVN